VLGGFCAWAHAAVGTCRLQSGSVTAPERRPHARIFLPTRRAVRNDGLCPRRSKRLAVSERLLFNNGLPPGRADSDQRATARLYRQSNWRSPPLCRQQGPNVAGRRVPLVLCGGQSLWEDDLPVCTPESLLHTDASRTALLVMRVQHRAPIGARYDRGRLQRASADPGSLSSVDSIWYAAFTRAGIG
jgi:hypothetical protein